MSCFPLRIWFRGSTRLHITGRIREVKIWSWKKKTIVAALLICMTVVVLDRVDIGAIGRQWTAKENQEQPSTELTLQEMPAYVADKAPVVSAQTAVVIDQRTGRVLYEKKMNEKIYPASTTKIMTGLLALEHTALTKQVKVSANAVKTEGSAIYLKPGETISMEDLLYGLMLRSGNDAALAIAEGVSGSVEDFVTLMNKRAAEIGANNTQFVNPNGLHDENHYTTSYDMALISREAMKIPEFRTIAGAKNWTAHREDGLYNSFYNKNKVVHQYEGATGIKIGYTKATGRTLVASSKRGDMELICVVMNAPNWFEDSYKLMDFVYNNYTMKTIAQGQQPLRSVALPNGERDSVLIGPKENILCPIVRGEQNGEGETSEISIQYDLKAGVKAPVSRWQEAGSLRIYVNDNFIYAAPLYYMEDIERKVK